VIKKFQKKFKKKSGEKLEIILIRKKLKDKILRKNFEETTFASKIKKKFK